MHLIKHNKKESVKKTKDTSHNKKNNQYSNTQPSEDPNANNKKSNRYKQAIMNKTRLNINYMLIENMIKNMNMPSLQKYSNNLDKRIKYLKHINSQKSSNNTNEYKNVSDQSYKYSIENNNYNSKASPVGESTFDNSDNRNYIHTESESIFAKKGNIYYKQRKDNMFFKLRKNSLKKNSLDTIGSKEDIIVNYNKFKNCFLITSDHISIKTRKKVKNTNNSFLNLLSLLENTDILRLFSTNREIRSGIVGCLAYKVKEKILPEFNKKYCCGTIFTKDFNFMILAKPNKRDKLYLRLILKIKPVITNLNKNIINKSVAISFIEYVNNKNFNKKKSNTNKDKIKVNTYYLFEVIEKLSPKNFWVFRENTSFHFDEQNNAYYNNVMQFWPGDKALINLNLISEMGIIDFDNFFWNEPKIAELFQKNNKKSKVNVCEVEEIVASGTI